MCHTVARGEETEVSSTPLQGIGLTPCTMCTVLCVVLVKVADLCVCCISGSAQQALQTPQTMLDEVVWCVSDAPQLARLDTLHPAVPLADAQSNRYVCSTHS